MNKRIYKGARVIDPARNIDQVMDIGTENGVTDMLSHTQSGKQFYPLSPSFICTDMKKITREDVKNALLYDTFEVNPDATVAEKARIPLYKMTSL